MKFKGVLVKWAPLKHKMTSKEAEVVEKLIKEGYIVIYNRKPMIRGKPI